MGGQHRAIVLSPWKWPRRYVAVLIGVVFLMSLGTTQINAPWLRGVAPGLFPGEAYGKGLGMWLFGEEVIADDQGPPADNPGHDLWRLSLSEYVALG